MPPSSGQVREAILTTAPASQNPRYEAHESPPLPVSLGFGLQFSLIASATLLIITVRVGPPGTR